MRGPHRAARRTQEMHAHEALPRMRERAKTIHNTCVASRVAREHQDVCVCVCGLVSDRR